MFLCFTLHETKEMGKILISTFHYIEFKVKISSNPMEYMNWSCFKFIS